MVFSSLVRGFGRAGKNVRLIFIIYFANLLTAAAISYPVYKLIESSLGSSGFSGEFFRDFPMHWISTWIFHNSAAVSGYNQLLLSAGVAYIIFSVVLLGGVLEILTKPNEKFSLSRFFHGIGSHIWGFLLLFIISSGIYFAILYYGNSYLQEWSEKMYEWWPSEHTDLLTTWGRWIILGAALAGFNALFDYTRIRYVLGRSGWILVSLARSFWFMITHIWKTFWLYYLLALFAGLVSTGYFFGVSAIEPVGIKEIGIIVGIQQIFILIRTWIRFSFYTGQTILFEKLNPVGVVEEEAEVSDEYHPEIDIE